MLPYFLSLQHGIRATRPRTLGMANWTSVRLKRNCYNPHWLAVIYEIGLPSHYKAGLHQQSFCDHSRNFAKVKSKFWRICKKCLGELTRSTLSKFLQTFLTNSSKLRIYLYAKFLLWSQKLCWCKLAFNNSYIVVLIQLPSHIHQHRVKIWYLMKPKSIEHTAVKGNTR